MAPNGAVLPKRKPKENNYIFDLGVRGRKTGLTLPDTGLRDEHGLEPMDGLFSSPAKPKSTVKAPRKINATLTSEEDMEMVESTIPDPEAVLEYRASIRMPPRSKSPIKTFLKSPARRNPSLGPVSSPTRGTIVAPRAASVVESVRRRLDFSVNEEDSSEDSITSKKRAGSALPATGNARVTTATRLSPLREPTFSNNGNRRDHDDTTGVDENDLIPEDSFQMINGGDDEPIPEPEESGMQAEGSEEEEEGLEPESEAVTKGKRKAAEANTTEKPTIKDRRGRPKKTDQLVEEELELPVERPSKRARQSLDQAPQATKKPVGRPKKTIEAPEPELESEELQLTKKQMGRPKKAIEKASEPEPEAQPKSRATKSTVSKLTKTTSTSGTAKARPRKQQLQTINETDSPKIKNGPPIPRSRGLLILRRETPAEGAGFKQTRSGRNSIKPIAYWKNERIDYDEDEEENNWGKFCLPKIKGVVRVDEVEQETRSRAKSAKPSKSKNRRTRIETESDDDEVAEPWETEPGEFVGEVRLWDPEDPTGVQTEEQSDQIALSSAAIVTRDVKNGSFKFAKTLTLPFFGSGMVDLPPGSVKKPKSSRKMQMVFFVYYGRVKVTVNDNTFRIGKGGMWQVPRGNFYSIENDYDNPARLFFAQGCERDEGESETQ
ncbi:Mif2/CENP-C like-domain-containing protein [Tricladium varicosporioides]|nr:Mif2/CENP-C like-domain-containing protein [Hymenoscyphus varicosporioides]